MRRRITLLVAATTSVVLLAFLLPAASLVARVADLIPVALLAGLVAVQVFSTGPDLALDARAAALAVAVVLLLLRAPFLVVVFGAALVAALLRLL